MFGDTEPPPRDRNGRLLRTSNLRLSRLRTGRRVPVVALIVFLLLVPLGLSVGGGVGSSPALHLTSAGTRATPSTSSANWTELTSSPTAPPAQSGAVIAYDPELGATFVFGGYVPSGYASGDTWELQGGTWTNLTPTLSISPPARWEPAFAYDPTLGSLVLFGGRNLSQFFNDTWTFNASGWHDVTGGPAPTPRTTSFVYDPSLGGLLMFGGGVKNLSTDGWTFYSDTWEFSAAGWQNLTAELPSSPPADATNLVFDAADNYVLVFGGATGTSPCSPRAFEWTFHNFTWTNRTADAATGPGGTNGIYAAGVAFDTALNAVVLFGGVTGTPGGGCYSTSDTWTYSGGTWTNLTSPVGPSVPGSRQSFLMTYDTAAGTTVLFGGNLLNSDMYYGDTWAFGANPNPWGPAFPATFAETGLPPAAPWSVMWGGVATTSSASTLVVYAQNGTFNFTVGNVTAGGTVYGPTPASGTIEFAGTPLPVNISFAAVTTTSTATKYDVSITESGLPSGTEWSVSLGGAVASSNGSTIVVPEPNGTYSFEASSSANYSVSYSTSVTVDGRAVDISLPFTFLPYAVTFLETGLPSGTEWSVVATDLATHEVTSGHSVASSVTLYLASGSYSLSATGPGGYRVSLSAAELTVDGSNPPSVSVVFESTTPSGLVPAWLSTATFGVLAATGLLATVGAGWGYTRYQYERRREEAQRWFREFQKGSDDSSGDDATPR